MRSLALYLPIREDPVKLAACIYSFSWSKLTWGAYAILSLFSACSAIIVDLCPLSGTLGVKLWTNLFDSNPLFILLNVGATEGGAGV